MNNPNTYKNSPIGKIPSDWEIKTLGYCCSRKGEYGINAAAVEYVEGLPRYIRITDIDDDGNYSSIKKACVDDEKSKDFILEKGDILFARTGATVGKTYHYKESDGELVFAGFLIRFRPNEKILQSKYLNFYTSTKPYWDWVKTVSMRSGQPGINAEEYSLLKLPLPPLPEQTRIAELLSTWDKAIQTNQQLLAQKELRKKWLMQQLLTGKRRLKGFEECNKIHKTDFGLKIPKDWNIVSVNDVFEERVEKSNDQSKYPLFSLTIENGLTEKTDRYERSFLLKDQENNQYKLVYPNDILFNPMNLRFGAIAKSKINIKVLVSAYYNTITKSSDLINIDFYDLLFKTDVYCNFYDRIAIGSLNEKKRVHLSNFIKLQIPLPSIEEQTDIAQVLQTADAEIQTLKTKLEKLKEQKKGLMQQLLTGKIRVKI